jgi:hypothetical protein
MWMPFAMKSAAWPESWKAGKDVAAKSAASCGAAGQRAPDRAATPKAVAVSQRKRCIGPTISPTARYASKLQDIERNTLTAAGWLRSEARIPAISTMLAA